MKVSRKRVGILGASCILLIFLISITSCGLSDIGKMNGVQLKAHPKVVLPIAYGTIELGPLLQYLNPDLEDSTLSLSDFYLFEQIFTEASTQDTMMFNGAILNDITDVEFRIETLNRIPLGIDLEFHFTDTLTFEDIDTPVTCSILKPAVIDDVGRAVEATHNIENIKISKDQLNNYKNSQAIILVFRFYIPESNSSTIILHKDDFLTLNAGLAIQVSTGEQQ